MNRLPIEHVPFFGGAAQGSRGLDRAERVVDGISVAVWTHAHTSIFGTTPTHRVCQAWFGTTIGPDGLYGEARRSIDHRLRSLVERGRWHVIDRKLPRSGPATMPLRAPRYFALTAADPEQVRFWLSDVRRDALMRTAATTLTQFDVRLFAHLRSRIEDAAVRNLVDTARRLM